MKKYQVITRDVDGRGSRTYKTFEKARAYFETMYGRSLEEAIAEQYFDANTKPAATDIRRVKAVSDFGTSITFQVKEEND